MQFTAGDWPLRGRTEERLEKKNRWKGCSLCERADQDDNSDDGDIDCLFNVQARMWSQQTECESQSVAATFRTPVINLNTSYLL